MDDSPNLSNFSPPNFPAIIYRVFLHATNHDWPCYLAKGGQVTKPTIVVKTEF